MKAVATLLALYLGCVLAINLSVDQISLKQFVDFQHKYNKVYNSDQEFRQRYQIFKSNLAIAQELNSRESGSAVYGVTKFMDLTPQEFANFYLMPELNVAELPQGTVGKPKDRKVGGSANFDWNSKGVVTPVYNQEQCGSCWAFSATETIESYWAIAGNTLTELSMQQIVDCDSNDDGCDGGWTYTAYQYVMSAGGLEALSAYPYTGETDNCAFGQNGSVVATISNWQYVTQSQDENAMYKWVASTGPLSICVDASSWQFYTSGVISSCTTNLDHCVQLTGYSSESGTPAWNVRNSWGTDWGNNGYIYLARGNDTCGCAQVVTAVSI